jgi:hypothetical protein
MFYESLGKGLVVQKKDASPLVNPTKSKLHCYLIVFVGRVSIHWSHLQFKVNLS